MLVELVELRELLFCCVESCDIGARGAFHAFMVMLASRCSAFLRRHYNGRQRSLRLADYWNGAPGRIGVLFHGNVLGGRPVIERLPSVYFHLGQAALAAIVRRLLRVAELVDLLLRSAGVFIRRFVVICVFLMTLRQISQIVIAALRSVIRNF